MIILRAVYKAVFPIHFSNGGSLEKGMARESAGLTLSGEDYLRLLFDRQHVRLQLHYHAAIIAQIVPSGGNERNLGCEPAVQPDPAIVIGQHAGIKGKLFSPLFPQNPSIFVVDFSVEFIFTGRRITDRDTNLAKKVKGVVQVVPSIGSPRHIGGV